MPYKLLIIILNIIKHNKQNEVGKNRKFNFGCENKKNCNGTW